MLNKMFPYLSFEGHGQEATHFYTDVLNAELVSLMTFGDAPDNEMGDMPKEAKDMVMNAQILLKNGDVLMISDVPPGMNFPFQKGNNISLTLTFDEEKEAQDTFDRLVKGGSVNMALQETFWSPFYGNLTDRFGIEWQISVDQVPTH